MAFRGNTALQLHGFGQGPGASANSGVQYDNDNDVFHIPTADGGVIIQFGSAERERDESDEDDHFENLAETLPASTMGMLAWQLLDGIASDDASRSQWLSDRARGLDLLAVKIEKPRANIGGGGAPLDGMSTVRHPLLLEACIRAQANAKRELLPAGGPCKIQNVGPAAVEQDLQAQKTEDLYNEILTIHRPEYYPDTDRMLFDQPFSGAGFKKIFKCPLRRMGVSDTVQSADLIVSNDAVDLSTAQRVTERVVMTRTTMKRMQFVGAYRNVELAMPHGGPTDPVISKQRRIQGIDASTRRPEDRVYTIYECYTHLVIDGDEHLDEHGNPTGLPRPYKVVIEKDSRQILEIRRNWEPNEDDNFEPIQVFVMFPFVPMFGFYPAGLLHILGNTTMAVTAAWRIMLDSGMFANFPGFLYAKNGARQDNLNFRVAPGGGTAVDLNGQDDIRKTIMQLPYKEPGQATMNLVENMVSTGRQVGGAAEAIDPSTIRQNMPVGTTMMLVEQAQQTMSAVHERSCVAQSREFTLLLNIWRSDPKSIWRLIAREGKWTYDELVQALNNYGFRPVADPNTPSHLHRIMKMSTLKTLEQQAPPGLYDPKAVDTAILESIKIPDPQRFFLPPPPPGQAPPPSDAVIIAQATQQAKAMEVQSRERIAQAKQQGDAVKAQMTATLGKLKLELDKTLGELKAHVDLAKAGVTSETADKDRMSVEGIEASRLAHQTGQAHIDRAMSEIGHHMTAFQAGLDAHSSDLDRMHEHHQAHLDRQHELQMASDERDHVSSEGAADRTHAIQLERIKPKPRISKGK